MPTQPDDQRPPLVIAMGWVSRITTVAVMMVLPGLIGLWLDDRWGTSPWLVICGTVVGFIVAMWQLLQIAQIQSNKDDSTPGGGET